MTPNFLSEILMFIFCFYPVVSRLGLAGWNVGSEETSNLFYFLNCFYYHIIKRYITFIFKSVLLLMLAFLDGLT